MRLNQFSVRVISGRETSGGYVEMQHGQRYSLSLRNARDRRCDARVEIDGKHVGTWRIEAGQNVVLERPADDDGCFTFYRAGSKKGAKAGITEGDPNNGLVVVTFTPEQYVTPIVIHRYVWPVHPWPWPPYEPYWPYRPYKPWIIWATTTDVSWTCDASAMSGGADLSSVCCSANVQDAMPDYQAGGTGLSGQSDQTYGVAGNIYHDHSQQTTISLRLVGTRKRQDEPRPLVAQGNPVPPPV